MTQQVNRLINAAVIGKVGCGTGSPTVTRIFAAKGMPYALLAVERRDIAVN
jgi:hypothetical protein